jgi:rhodanese-related sulfurtransferase
MEASMDRAIRVFLVLACLAALRCPAARAQEFSGTIYIAPNLITSADPTTLTDLTDEGRGIRRMFDRRVDGFIDVNAFLFKATFSDGLSWIEIQVNPEFGEAGARAQAERFAQGLYEGRGVTANQDTIAYCRIGERSSLTWYVLKYLLGYPNVKNYDGSWTEWGNLIEAPIEK